MNAETKERRLVELLHGLTQQGKTILIQEDFPGMLNVTVGDGSHQHLGIPHGSLKDLEVYLRNHLASELTETTAEGTKDE